jgi:hypothetical protein
MGIRPRTRQKLNSKLKRCPKCGALVRTRKRCKKCQRVLT